MSDTRYVELKETISSSQCTTCGNRSVNYRIFDKIVDGEKKQFTTIICGGMHICRSKEQ